MNWKSKSLLAVAALTIAAQASAAQITFYEGQDFRGRSFTTTRGVAHFRRFGFNERASSVVVDSGRWEVCEDDAFKGNCVVLRPGSYDSLARMGMNNQVSSVRMVKPNRRYAHEAPEPLPQATYEYRRRPNERVYEVPVTWAHAVVGPPERRCWVEREQVTQPDRGGVNVGGAILGAVIGGVIGHQVGQGRGNDAATAGGAVVGAAIGANAGRDNGGRTFDRDVRRCDTTPSGPPDYWEVTYNFHGIEHRVQMDGPPGRTIVVNAQGEPRQ